MKEQGTNLPFFPQQLKILGNIYQTVVFTQWVSGSIVQWSLRDLEPTRWALWWPCCLEREFQAPAQGRRTQVDPWALPELKRWHWVSWEAEVTRAHTEDHPRRENCSKRERHRFSVGPLHLPLSTDQCTHVRKLPNTTESNTKKLEEIILGAHTDRNGLGSTSPHVA